MSNRHQRTFCFVASVMISGWIAGCGDSPAPEANKPVKKTTSKPTEQVATSEPSAGDSQPASQKAKAPSDSTFAPVKLGGATGASDAASSAKKQPSEKQVEDVKQALKPIQVLLGQWHGSANKLAGGAKGYEELKWVWDWKTDRAQPALAMTTEGSAYMKSVRLTYLAEEQKFQMTIEDKEGQRRELRGTFTQEPTDKPGEDKKQTPQRTYKLLLTEVGDVKDRWQVVVNQQENNRYLLEISQARGKNFTRLDTIGTQRENTSFALSDEDFKDRTCVISQGLGTIQLSNKGKSYWVCCTGCKAAFEEDPDKWIAKFEAMQTPK